MSSLEPPDPNALKNGDTTPLQATLSDINGPINLASASVQLRMKNLATSALVSLAGTNSVLQGIDGTTGRITLRGQVKYVWAMNETNTSGIYGIDWVVTFPDGSKRSFPNDRLVTLRILDPA